MSITSIPTQTDGSAGRVKSNAQPVTNLNVQVPASEHNVIVAAICAVTAEVGLSDGSIPGSIIARLNDLEAGAGDATSIQGEPVSATTPTTGQVLVYNGTTYVPTTFAGGTLDAAMTGGTPDNAVTLPGAHPLVISGVSGAMLSLGVGNTDTATVRADSLTLATRASDATITLTTDTVSILGKGGTAVGTPTVTGQDSGTVFINTGATNLANNAGAIYIVGGDSGTGTPGSVQISGGSSTGSAGAVDIYAGLDLTDSSYGIISTTSDTLDINTATTTGGSVNYNKGITLDNAKILSGDDDPDTQVAGTLGSLFLNTTAGTIHTSNGGTSWSTVSTGGSPVLWRWNGTDTSQFGSKLDLGIGAGITTLTLDTVAGGPNGLYLRLNSGVQVAGGAVVFPIDFAFPKRYVIDVTYGRFTFNNVSNPLVGITAVSDVTATNSLMFAHSPGSQTIQDFALSAGTPFGPAWLFNNQVAAVFDNNTGLGGANTATTMSLKYTINMDRPFAAQPNITVTIDGSGSPGASNNTRGNYCSTYASAYPGSWNGITADTIGLFMGNSGAVAAWNVQIESLQILKHPLDL